MQALGDVITVARVPWKQRISAFATEELEIAVSTHASTPEKIFDDESRNRPVCGDDQGSLHISDEPLPCPFPTHDETDVLLVSLHTWG